MDNLVLGIMGLGLIGGSFAKACKEFIGCKIYGFDKDINTMQAAMCENTIDAKLDEKTLKACDIVLVCLYPSDCVEFIIENKDNFKKGAKVIDCAGVKRSVCEKAADIAKENGFIFIGGHPMAGTVNSGYANSKSNMFKGASMILCPCDCDIAVLNEVREFFATMFSKIVYTTPKEHDRIIAYTSQLAHVVSNAYIKSPTDKSQKGFSAGSYKDMVRVAKLNHKMWTELFFENKDNLIFELDTLIKNLEKYKNALCNDDKDEMCKLLEEGSQR